MTSVADDGTPLAGTLTLPAGQHPSPAVLLLQGSGALDRDGNSSRVRMNLGPPLAAALAERGVASLRYDRRGTGATPGDWRATGFTAQRRDAEAALRALAERPEVLAGSLGVCGHSEGAVHSMALAARGQVRAAVLLAGFARRGEDALRRQFQLATRELPAPVRALLPLVRKVGRHHVAWVRRTGGDVARYAGIPVNARWTREMLDHDSRTDLAAVRVPVLAVTGGKDVQVDPADLEEIRRLVPEAETHSPPDLTHLLRRDPGPPAMRSYSTQLRRPVDSGLLAQVADWLGHRLTDPHGARPEPGHTAAP